MDGTSLESYKRNFIIGRPSMCQSTQRNLLTPFERGGDSG
jgi:hypothetical protein